MGVDEKSCDFSFQKDIFQNLFTFQILLLTYPRPPFPLRFRNDGSILVVVVSMHIWWSLKTSE